MAPRGILFLCVANSARSQMAEGWARHLAPGAEIHSAGSAPAPEGVNPFAIEAMREIGIDLTTHTSKSVHDIPLERIATVITLCAEEVCPAFPGGEVERHHWPLDDPAANPGGNEAVLAAFRRVRDQLGERIKALPGAA
jgi:arsenate reductase